MHRYCNCPQCRSPDVVVVRRPDVVGCLVCGCPYLFDEFADGSAPDDQVAGFSLGQCLAALDSAPTTAYDSTAYLNAPNAL
jgi:hypothetical protein